MLNKYSELLSVSKNFYKLAIDVSSLIQQALHDNSAAEVLFDYLLETNPALIKNMYNWTVALKYLIYKLKHPEINIIKSDDDYLISYTPSGQNLTFYYFYYDSTNPLFKRYPFKIMGNNPSPWSTYQVFEYGNTSMILAWYQEEREYSYLQEGEQDKLFNLHKKFEKEWHLPLFNLAVKLNEMALKINDV